MQTPTYIVTVELPFKDDAHPDPIFIVTSDELKVLAGVLVRSNLSDFRVSPNHIHSIQRTEVEETINAA